MEKQDKVPTEKERLLTYLEEVFSAEFPKLVGKIIKRFEILENKDSLKKEIKELIYESSREMQDIFYAFSKGLEVSYFKLVRKDKENGNGK